MDTEDRDDLTRRAARLARDAAAVVVGLGILGVNRLQLTRRELAARLGPDDRSREQPER